MPKISLDSTCIRIELTAAEAASYGCGLNRSQCLRKKRSSGGGVLLELFSIDLTKTQESSEVVALIPPAVIYPDSSGSPAQSTPRLGESLSSLKSANPIPGYEKPYSAVSGWNPHRSTVPEAMVAAIGATMPTGSAGEPSGSSTTESPNLAVIRRHSPLHPA